ncbi:MAG: type I restriction enzyme HsdR N-terminal domain-containing protein, partial [Muribaculaceae bacterium]|nr:type I restriction enzyme HsdR N-terminal domain-containing protein [Muribaculaceae bacterium]
VLRSHYLIVSNGLRHFCCEMDYEKETYRFIPRIPTWTSEM